MNSEHRHELKENELGRLAIEAKGVLEKHGNQILLALIGALLLIGGGLWWVNSSRAKAAAGWSKYVAASTAEDFAGVADKFPATDVGQWSRLNEAEHHLFNGLQLAFTDREGAKTDLDKAKTEFREILSRTPMTPVLRERALFGLARTLEVTTDGDTSEAVKVYEELSRDFRDGIYGQLAVDRVERLKSNPAQSFYAWFHDQKPTPKDRPAPKDGLPAGHSPLDFGLPEPAEKPTSEKPDGERKDGDKPDAEKPEGDKKDGDKPDAAKPDAEKKDAEKPEADKKDADKPADGKPKEESPKPEKPADEKPAKEEPKKDAEPKKE